MQPICDDRDPMFTYWQKLNRVRWKLKWWCLYDCVCVSRGINWRHTRNCSESLGCFSNDWILFLVFGARFYLLFVTSHNISVIQTKLRAFPKRMKSCERHIVGHIQKLPQVYCFDHMPLYSDCTHLLSYSFIDFHQLHITLLILPRMIILERINFH